jgi:biopolymer transport protein ExbB
MMWVDADAALGSGDTMKTHTWLLAGLAALLMAGAIAATPPAEPDAPKKEADAGEKAPKAAPEEKRPEPTKEADEGLSPSEAFFQKLAKGGNTMIALLACSVMGGAFALERLFRLRQAAIVPSGLADRADELWREGDFAALEAECASRPSTLGRVIRYIVLHRDNAVADISAGAGDIAANELKHHLQRTYPLAVVATLSPLLGLLGTVFGMIEAFDRVAVAGALGDATLLADGISKALITTAAGLVIAVPALAIYHYFRSRTNIYGIQLAEQVTELTSGWLMKRNTDHAS